MVLTTRRTAPACLVASALLAAPAVSAADVPGRVSSVSALCSLGQLPGLSAQYARAVRVGTAGRTPTDVRSTVPTVGVAGTDFVRVAQGILGGPLDGPALVDLPCTNAVRARDQVAWSMSLAGYSSQDIGDVLEGTTTLADLDEARFRLMSGQPRQAVSAFLDARRQAMLAAATATPPASTVAAALPVPFTGPGALAAPTSVLDAELRALARIHRVSPDLVRAVITAESNWNARAVSDAGAIGLMQLMPATAASLGVNPWHPVDNLRGGITYLGSLLRSYGENARLALIAYHAGPLHANRVRDGLATTHSATRRYLDTIAETYPLR